MRMRRRAALLLGLGLLPMPALAQGQGQGQGQGRGGGGQGQGGQGGRGNQGGNQGGNRDPLAVSLGALEQSIVRSWLGQNPGFSVQPLPPGMRNRLAQGKPLPPGIQRRVLPGGLLGRLPPRPGYDYVMIGTALVLMHAASGAVAAILDDAFRR